MESRPAVGNPCAAVLDADGIVAERDMLSLPCGPNRDRTASPHALADDTPAEPCARGAFIPCAWVRQPMGGQAGNYVNACRNSELVRLVIPE